MYVHTAADSKLDQSHTNYGKYKVKNLLKALKNVYHQTLTHILLFGTGYTPLKNLQQSAWFPLNKFLQIVVVRLHFWNPSLRWIPF
jgi:hypothetical protein